MPVYLLFIVILVVFVILLVRAEFYENRKKINRYKPVSSALLIVIALLSMILPQEHNQTYSIAILLGLMFSFGGDITLMQRTQKAFMVGLVLFLLSHIVYFITFTFFNGFFVRNFASAFILTIMAILIFLYLRPGLGNMKYPVLIYIIIISIMMLSALNTFESDYFTLKKSLFITIGAGLFYVSDVILAVNKFRKPFRYNRVSLAFYYSGQLLIALSTSSVIAN
ncbi:hypothetical protein GF337_15710 [candidate division KSB1 bacterium]|nr:hypothetical protein [candidate division KSB1 bacterium]